MNVVVTPGEQNLYEWFTARAQESAVRRSLLRLRFLGFIRSLLIIRKSVKGEWREWSYRRDTVRTDSVVGVYSSDGRARRGVIVPRRTWQRPWKDLFFAEPEAFPTLVAYEIESEWYLPDEDRSILAYGIMQARGIVSFIAVVARAKRRAMDVASSFAPGIPDRSIQWAGERYESGTAGRL